MKKNIIFLLLISYSSNLFAQKSKGPDGKAKTIFTKTVNFRELSLQQKNKTANKQILVTPENAGGKEEDEGEELNEKIILKDEEKNIAPAAKNNFSKQAPQSLSAVVNCKGFEGLNEIFTNTSPPDVSMATGMDHLLMAINAGILITNKNTGYVDSIINTTFWGGLGFTDFYDPKVLFDQLSGRWIMIIDAERKSAISSICIAVSQTYDPTGNWTIFYTDADPSDVYWLDYPSIGFSNDKIVITGNMFTFTGTNASFTRTYVYNKIDLYNGTVAASTNYFDDATYFTLVPATQFDNISNLYCVTQQDGPTGKLSRYTVSGSAASPTMSAAGTIDYPYAWGNASGDILPQTGTAIKINAGGSRMLAYVVRNNIGYVAFTGGYPSGGPTSAGATFGSFNNTSLAVIDLAAFYDPAGTWMTAYPNLIVTSDGTIVISCSYFSTTTYGSAAVGIWNTANGAYSNASIYATKFGDDLYDRSFGGRNRWGDYSGICVDPSDDKTVWMASEYAHVRDPGPAASRWGTWFSKYCGDCPANLTVSNTLANGNIKKYEVTNTITSTQNLSSGSYLKLDAANAIIMSPGFRAQVGSILKAFIEGCGGADF